MPSGAVGLNALLRGAIVDVVRQVSFAVIPLLGKLISYACAWVSCAWARIVGVCRCTCHLQGPPPAAVLHLGSRG